MNVDLERELAEFPEFGPVVSRLRAARRIESRGGSRPVRARSTAEWLLAASLMLAFALSAVFLSEPRIYGLGSQASNLESAFSYGAREYRLSPEEMIASQNADGSWQNDFLTRRNAEVLLAYGTPAAQLAYRKAVRNLRVRGYRSL